MNKEEHLFKIKECVLAEIMHQESLAHHNKDNYWLIKMGDYRAALDGAKEIGDVLTIMCAVGVPLPKAMCIILNAAVPECGYAVKEFERQRVRW